ncbi:class I SAM-dependent methyltransferase [Rubripirellula amarantea]|nr:class I SAM-dependent methyltransferase [Rubripirellula amarantea]
MPLLKIEIPSSVDGREIPSRVKSRISADLARIEAFQDCWDRPQIEQFVAADFFHMYQSLDWTLQTQLTIGKRFIEWGCGFAVVSAMASTLGLSVVGIEAESALIEHGRATVRDWNEDVEIVHGNFLPDGAESLADDDYLPSLGHAVASAYQTLGLDLDDFAIVYSYPWPGEDDFHEAVFERYACVGALLIMFCGPNDIRLYRKGSR